MPADPFRLRVQKALTAALKGITPDNGFEHDLSDFTDDHGRPAERVFRGRDEFGANDPLPMLSVLEDPRSLDPNNASDGNPETTGNYRLLIQGFVPDDLEHPTDPAHHLAADVITALVRTKADKFDILGLGRRSPCVTKMVIGQPVVRPADNDISSVAFCFLSVTLTLVEDMENPRAL